MKPDVLYCIIHEAWVYPELMDYTPKDCILVSSMPPELPENWEQIVQVPDDEELKVMDENAEALWFDLNLV